MAKIKEIRNRIKSVSATHKITRTMEMVAAGRMKRAMDRMIEARPFVKGLTEVVNDLISGELTDHPMLQDRSDVKREAIVVFSSNRGLCGAFNTNLFREGVKEINRVKEAGRQVEVHTVGKKVTVVVFRDRAPVSVQVKLADRNKFKSSN